MSAFTNAGGTISQQIWHPLGTQDFSSYMPQIQAANPDVLFVGSAGGPDAILLYQAFTGFGLKDTVPLIGNCCFADQVFLREIGDIAEGVQSFKLLGEAGLAGGQGLRGRIRGGHVRSVAYRPLLPDGHSSRGP